MYLTPAEIIIGAVLLLGIFVMYVRSVNELRTLKRNNCIGPDHNWFADYQERAYMCRRCGKWEGMDD